MLPIFRVAKSFFGHEKGSADTFDRLIESKHVADLRAIVAIASPAILFSVVVVVLSLFVIIFYFACHWPPKADQISAILTFFGLIGGLCLVASGSVAWCYQTASARLGIVDLFSCEITTICRVCSIVELADKCIKAFEVDSDANNLVDPEKMLQLREGFSHFDVAESYTPIFDANAKDLEVLNVKSVTHITAFYTYWKATQDAFRRVANTPFSEIVRPQNIELDAWHYAMRNLIYMQYLAYESARKAVRELIEFEPSHAENTITILLSVCPKSS